MPFIINSISWMDLVDPYSATISHNILKMRDKKLEIGTQTVPGFSSGIRILVPEIALFQDFAVVLPERRIVLGGVGLGVSAGARSCTGYPHRLVRHHVGLPDSEPKYVKNSICFSRSYKWRRREKAAKCRGRTRNSPVSLWTTARSSTRWPRLKS